MMLGVWLTDAEAAILAGWRTNANFFILPRLVQRLLFNLGINKVKQLRVDTVGIVEKNGLQPVFHQMNSLLPVKYRRDKVVKLCDEIMYVVGFAGIGGTSACCETAAHFMQLKIPKEFPEKGGVDFGSYNSKEKMLDAYRKDPVAYFKESCRIDPPVTSATSLLRENTTVLFNRQQVELSAGTLRQYVISLANRDPGVFQQPELFNPARENLNQALTWNGALGVAGDESKYPRICPGRYLSLDVATSIFNYAIKNNGP
ncbi:unnamed protein product [Polarella glacialis]|uniref:Uncharacterized protein n=1 Tax=Polarella glacialis TaxID=89957 RepID=A0A813EIS7_POLGL|nr:unnamed protein product [Polarella glacialis]